MELKRVFDVLVSGIGLVIISPAFILIGIAIKLETPGPVFYRQERVGQFGRTFLIHKFRTMFHRVNGLGSQLTVGSDPRITRVGGFLRKYKIDETAQLIDVLLGNMSLVGPRPEVPEFVAFYPAEKRSRILSVKPGITDWASICFKDENSILDGILDPRAAYLEKVLPVKLKYYEEYVEKRSFKGDLVIISATIRAIIFG
jgi:lipopolysaccharide/colanic/teichoic acid biosynthesis glycosyltransferase